MEIEVKIEYGKAFHIRVGITSLEVNVVDGTTLSYGGQNKKMMSPTYIKRVTKKKT